MKQLVLRQRILWILLILGMVSSGCVYYNTFFNARQSFNEAEKYRKKTGQGTQVGYKTAIDKSLKVVENHPNSKYYDDALFVLGVSYYYTEQYNKSERRLRELLTDFPKSKFVKEGTLYLAKAKLKIGEVEPANALFEEIVQGKYDKNYRAEAAMALGDYYTEQKDQASALRYYMAVRDSLGDERQKLEAQRYIADGYFDQFKFADALKGYLQVLGLKPDHNQKFHALYQAAVCSYRLQRIPVGLDYLAQLSKDPLYFDSLGAITLAVGEGHEAAGDLELAESVYQDVAMSSKNGNWVGEAYYRLGLIYQFDYDDVDQAKKYYDKSSQSSGGTSSGQDARSRSSDIGRLQALTKAGLDTAAVRMAQEGLDSLLPEDSVDIILEMKLPVPKDTTKGADSLLAKRPADTLKTKDSVGVNGTASPVSADSTKVKDTVKVGDSTKVTPTGPVKDTTKALSRSTLDSLRMKKLAAVLGLDTATSKDSSKVAPAAGTDTSLHKDTTKVVSPKDSIRVSDTALLKVPVVAKDLPPVDTGVSKSPDSSALSNPDTSAVKATPPTVVKPPIQVDSSAKKTLDSLAAKKQDTVSSKVSPKVNLQVPPVSAPIVTPTVPQVAAAKDSTAARIADTVATHDTTSVAKKPDSLAVKDTTAVKVQDSLGTRDTTARGKDSLSAGANADSTGAKNVTKTIGKTAPKSAKDSGLTRAQIFKRINDAAESQYTLAELYWFQLDKPDSAMKELSELLRVFPKSDRAPEAMIALSQMYRDYKADTVGADSLLRTVLTNYPHSDYVPEALRALGLQGTAADTGYAEYYMKRAENFLFDQKNPDSARYYYRYVARQFPRSHFRDQAAYSAIWVVENYKSPGDSSVYYAYKQLASALPGSPYATEASKRLTYTPPPPVPKPSAEKPKGPLTRADSILAQGNNLVGSKPAGADTAATYIDPLQAVYKGPRKEDLIIIDLKPVQTAVDFTYPTEAYDLEGNRFELYFQVLLDATGKVIDLALKIPTSSEEMNRRAQLTVASMTFDPLDVSKQLQQKAINMILPEEQTDPRGRWYVFKYVITKPDYLNK